MDTYLSSPVCPLQADYAAPVSIGVIWDVDERRLNFGRASQEAPQSRKREAFFDLQFSPVEESEADDLATFLGTIRGRFRGFWVVDLMREAGYVSGTGTTLVVEDEAWADWHALGYTHIAIETSGVTQYREVEGISASNDRETLTLGASATFAADSRVWFLRYVQLADDTVEHDYRADWRPGLTLRCIDLPHEYGSTAATATITGFLYTFAWTSYADDTYTLRYTSAAQALTIGSDTWQDRAIRHGDIVRRIDGQNEAAFEFSSFTNHPATWRQAQWEVQIDSARFGTDGTYVSNSRKRLFTGRGLTPTRDGQFWRMECVGRLNRGDAKFPKIVFSPFAQTDIEDEVTLTGTSASISTVAAGKKQITIADAALASLSASDYQGLGWLVTSRTHPEVEAAGILNVTVDSSTQWTITLDAPLDFATNSDTVTLYQTLADTIDQWEAAGASRNAFIGHPFWDTFGLQLGAITRSANTTAKK